MESCFLLDVKNGRYILQDKEQIYDISIPTQPFFHNSITLSDGTPAREIGSLRGDRLSVSIDKRCRFWGDVNLGCKFCAIGATSATEPRVKRLDQVVEIIDFALSDLVAPAKHVYLNSGFIGTTDNGIAEYARIVSEIKKRFRIHIHLNPSPPTDFKYIDLLHDAGLDEISFNIDIFDPRSAREIIPGKFGLREIYIRMLEYSVKVFGSPRVSSCLVVGLEPADGTIEGLDFLFSRGVVPKLSSFRPLLGSLLQLRSPPKYDFLVDIYARAKELMKKWALPLGPLCGACQLQSIVLPFDLPGSNGP